jgi:anti-anti-sigma factor
MPHPDVQRSGLTLTVVPKGVLGADRVGELRPEVREQIAGGARDVIFDLREVHALDSTGIGFMIATHNTLQGCGGALRVIEVRADILRLLTTMRLDRHFSIEAGGAAT